jgi:hypothetical protein
MPRGVREVHASAVASGVNCVMGGYRTGYLSDCGPFDPAGGAWTPALPMNQVRAFAAGECLNGKLYVIGGQDGASCFNAMEENAVPKTPFALQKQ